MDQVRTIEPSTRHRMRHRKIHQRLAFRASEQPRTVLERASIGTLLRRNNTLTGEQESE